MRKGAMLAVVVGVLAVVAFLALRPSTTGGEKARNPKENASATTAAGKPAPGRGRLLEGDGSASPAASAAPTGGGASAGRVVFFSPWGGSTRDQLGRERPQEGNPVGPMSLASDGKGRIYVLDQVNNRIVRRGPDGSVEGTSDLKVRLAEDIAVGKDGSLAVLDRHGDKAIALYGADGAVKAQLPLAGDGVEDTSVLTGVFVDGDDVYVEREHGPLVKIGDVNGIPASARTEIPGRPTRDGLSYISAGITDQVAGRAYVSSTDRKSGEHRFTREERYRGEISQIVLLDSDSHGTVYFAVELHEDPSNDWVELRCLDGQTGATTGTATLPANTMPEQTVRDFTVLDDGGVIYAVRAEDGVSYRRYDCGG